MTWSDDILMNGLRPRCSLFGAFVLLISGLYFVYLTRKNKKKENSNVVGKHTIATEEKESTIKLLSDVTKHENLIPILDKIIDRRLSIYDKLIVSVARNMYLQALFLALALLFAGTGMKDWKFDALGVTITPSTMQLFLPAALLILWLQFGYLVHNAIDMRLIVWDLAEHRESLAKYTGKLFSLRMTLRDNFFIDLWFTQFHLDQSGFIEKYAKGALSPFLLFLFSVFLGLGHGWMVALVSCHGFDYANTSFIRWIHVVVIIGIALLLFASHHQFHIIGENKNWAEYVVYESAVIFAAFLPALRDAPPDIVMAI